MASGTPEHAAVQHGRSHALAYCAAASGALPNRSNRLFIAAFRVRIHAFFPRVRRAAYPPDATV